MYGFGQGGGEGKGGLMNVGSFCNRHYTCLHRHDCSAVNRDDGCK